VAGLLTAPRVATEVDRAHGPQRLGTRDELSMGVEDAAPGGVPADWIGARGRAKPMEHPVHGCVHNRKRLMVVSPVAAEVLPSQLLPMVAAALNQ
jgi:hypothetical protein